MKSLNLLATLSLLLFATLSFAQELPKKEFTVSVSEKNIELVAGETKKIDVTLLRSKSFRNTEINLSIGSILPEGISVTFEDGADPVSQRVMIISAAADAQAFQKSIILKANSSRATKAIMMKVSLDAQALSVN